MGKEKEKDVEEHTDTFTTDSPPGEQVAPPRVPGAFRIAVDEGEAKTTKDKMDKINFTEIDKLLSLGIDIFHDALPGITQVNGMQYDGWVLTSKEKEFYDVLAKNVVAMIDVKYLPLIIILVIVTVIETGKVGGYIAWRAPLVKKTS